MKLPFFSRNNDSASSSLKSRWPWPSCHQPRTLSFRNVTASINEDDEWASFSGEDDQYYIETLIRSVRSEGRLFKPAGETKSIVEFISLASEEYSGILTPQSAPPFKKCMILSMESDDPFRDFKESMEEMVEAQGLKEWTDLEQLLIWYLKVNGKTNHAYIVGAFVNLLIGLASTPAVVDHLTEASSSSCTTACNSCCCCDSTSQRPAAVAPSVSPSSPLSFYTFSNSSEECDSSCYVTVSHRSVSAPPEIAEQIGADEEDDATSASFSSSPFK